MTMPYFRRNNRMRPINSLKHVFDKQGGITLNTRQVEILAVAVENPVTTNPVDVTVGSRISSIYLNVQVVATTQAALPNAYFIIYKNPGANILAAAIPEANAVGASDFRKQVFHQEMRMMSDSNESIPITMFNGVLKIPQRFSRMGVNDQLVIQFIAPGVDIEYCIQCIYKEFR